MKKQKEKNNIFVKKKMIIFVILIGVIIWTIWGNLAVGVTHYTICDSQIPENFNGYKIVQISDLHNVEFGKNNELLIKKIKEENPDIIVMTGDLLDAENPNFENVFSFVSQCAKIACCYYVTGNHESWFPDYQKEQFESGLVENGVIILHNSSVSIVKNNQSIILEGIDDPCYNYSFVTKDNLNDLILNELDEIDNNVNCYKILLVHRPEAFDVFVEKNINLVLSGHVHGGQVRIPFIGGLFAPGQGLFPKYDSGIYKEKNTVMVVNRGLKKSLKMLRINNRPEIVSIILKC